MTETGPLGIAAAQAFIDAFNAQDHERLANTLNYPHYRLGGNDRYYVVEDADRFVEGSRRGEPQLAKEGWHHTVVESIEVVHASSDKVHLAITNVRCREGGTPYRRFETFWIATLQDGHWGIKFRSSFLENAKIDE